MKRLHGLFLTAVVCVTPCLMAAENDSSVVDTTIINATTQAKPSSLEEVLSVPSAAPLGPRDLIAQYESGMSDIGNRMSSDLASISEAVQKKELTREEAEAIIGERYKLAMMQFQLLSALHDIAVEDLAQSSTGTDPNAAKSPVTQTANGMVLLSLPFSSFELNPSLAKYLKLDLAQSQAIQRLMSDERRRLKPLMEQLETTRQRLRTANQRGRYDKDEVHSLAAAQARMLTALITANAQMQTKLYKLLTPEQRAKLDHIKQAGDLAVVEGE